VIRSVVQTNEKSLGVKSGLYGECCSSSQLISFCFKLSHGPIARWGTVILKNDIFLQQTWSIAANRWS